MPRRKFVRRSGTLPSPSAHRLDVVEAYLGPTAVTGAAFALVYGGVLLPASFIANTLWMASSFAVQTGAAVLSARLLLGAPPRDSLVRFASVLLPQEIFFVVASSAAVLVEGRSFGPSGAIATLLFFLATFGWTAVLKWRFFRGVGRSAGRGRAFAAMTAYYGFVALFVAAYARSIDTLPYPPGRP